MTVNEVPAGVLVQVAAPTPSSKAASIAFAIATAKALSPAPVGAVNVFFTPPTLSV